MVLGLIGAIAAVPAIIGTTEAVRQGQKNNAREEHRARRSDMVVSLPAGTKSKHRDAVDGGLVVLFKNRLWVRTNSSSASASRLDTAHPFMGYFLQHPAQQEWREAGHDPRGEGLVSTISEDPPFLNWIYVDGRSHAVCYGTRSEVEGNKGRPGPWNVTTGIGTDKGTGLLGGGRRMTFEGWEGFVAVEESVDVSGLEEDDADEGFSEDRDERPHEMLWGIYFDIEDDGLSSGGRIGSNPGKYNMLEVSLTRREKKLTRSMAMEQRKDRVLERRKEDERQKKRMEEIHSTDETQIGAPQAEDDPKSHAEDHVGDSDESDEESSLASSHSESID